MADAVLSILSGLTAGMPGPLQHPELRYDASYDQKPGTGDLSFLCASR